MKRCYDRNPYTYLIGWTDLDVWYYGARWAKGCHPGDLWVKYFSSSNNVKNFRTIHGEPDVIEVTDTFNTIEQAKEWESIVIKLFQIVESKHWLNLCSPDKQFQCVGGWKLSREQRERKSIRFSGTGNPMYGKSISEETRRKLSEVRKGKRRVFSEQAIQNIRDGVKTRRVRHFSNEERMLRSEKMKSNNPMLNEKSRIKVSQSKIGKMWITNEIVSLLIDTSKIIPEGFRRGRKTYGKKFLRRESRY